MMEILTWVYLVYMFVALYLMSLFVLIYLRNRKQLFSFPKPNKKYELSVLVPAYNEENTIEETIHSIFKSKYKPIEVIVINDGSNDDTKKIVEKLLRRYPRLKLIDKKNSGKANSLNYGVKQVKGELVAVIDADSYPTKDAMGKMVGFFNDEKVAAVTNSIMVKNKDKFITILQSFEYSVIAWTRKLLDYIDSVYVTNGPLSIYRVNALNEVGGFDPNNMTEDIEVTWHLISKGYKVRMCLAAKTYTMVPTKFRDWKRQRIRWNIGGIQTTLKYKSLLFKKTMLGYFIMPYFIVAWGMGILGFSIFVYLFSKRLLTVYLSTSYSLYAQTAVLTMQEINLAPSVLIYFGFFLLLFSICFTSFGLYIIKEGQLKRQNIFNLLFYLITYLTVFPILLILSIFCFVIGKYRW